VSLRATVVLVSVRVVLPKLFLSRSRPVRYDTGTVATTPAALLATLNALEQLPYRPLGLADAVRVRGVLDEGRSLLELARRVAAQGGPALDFERFEDLMASQHARLQDALNRPVAVASSLRILEERWFAANPGKTLDTTPVLLLLLTPTGEYSAEDWAFRSTCAAFVVREGVIENSPRGVRYRLLAAPAWYSAFAPLTVHTRDVFGAGAGNITQLSVRVDDLDETQLETLHGLWTPDVLSDLLDLQRVKEAVLALAHLDRREDAAAARVQFPL